MPLLLSKSIDESSTYAVWSIKETFQELQLKLKKEAPEGLDSKKSEWLVTRIMAQLLCKSHQIPYSGIKNDEYGKPFLIKSKAHISITHSWPMAAVMIHTDQPCGIDLELPRQKLKIVRSRFLNPGEDEKDLTKLCKIWAAKEVLYKIHGRKQLSLRDDIMTQFISDELLEVCNTKEKRRKTVKVRVEELNEYILAYNIQ